MNLGEGAYRIGSNFEHKDDVFAININKLKDDDSFKPATISDILDSSFDTADPI